MTCKNQLNLYKSYIGFDITNMYIPRKNIHLDIIRCISNFIKYIHQYKMCIPEENYHNFGKANIYCMANISSLLRLYSIQMDSHLSIKLPMHISLLQYTIHKYLWQSRCCNSQFNIIHRKVFTDLRNKEQDILFSSKVLLKFLHIRCYK